MTTSLLKMRVRMKKILTMAKRMLRCTTPVWVSATNTICIQHMLDMTFHVVGTHTHLEVWNAAFVSINSVLGLSTCCIHTHAQYKVVQCMQLVGRAHRSVPCLCWGKNDNASSSVSGRAGGKNDIASSFYPGGKKTTMKEKKRQCKLLSAPGGKKTTTQAPFTPGEKKRHCKLLLPPRKKRHYTLLLSPGGRGGKKTTLQAHVLSQYFLFSRHKKTHMCLFVHASGTTGMDSKQRKRHKYARKCSQCGVALSSDTHVAAHVVAHPVGCGFCGVMTLKTTCKKCNNVNSPKKQFWGLGMGKWMRFVPRFGCVPRPHDEKKKEDGT